MSRAWVTVRSSAIHGWPRVRPKRSGAVVVQGRYIGVMSWHLLAGGLRRGFRILGLLLILLAFIPGIPAVLDHADRDGFGADWIGSALRMRIEVADFLVNRHPGIGEFLYYGGRSRYDLHLAAFGFLMALGAVYWASALTWAMHILLWPFLSKRLKVTFSPEEVILHRWWGGIRMPRGGGDGDAIAFRTGSYDEAAGVRAGLAQRIGASELSAALVSYGFRCHAIAMPRNARRVERVVAACQYALKKSRPVWSGGKSPASTAVFGGNHG